jgi:hypothetical protein
MQAVVAASWRLEKPLVRFHVGDLAWARYQHTGREHEWRIRLWEDRDGEPVGWAWLHLPSDGELHVRPDLRRELVPEVVAWLAAEAADHVRITALDRDRATVDSLRAEGFEPSEQGFNAMVRELDGDLPEPGLRRAFARATSGARLTSRVASPSTGRRGRSSARRA